MLVGTPQHMTARTFKALGPGGLVEAQIKHRVADAVYSMRSALQRVRETIAMLHQLGHASIPLRSRPSERCWMFHPRSTCI